MGVARYRLLEYVDEGTPYLMAEIGVFAEKLGRRAGLAARADEAFSFERVAKAAYKLGGGRGRLPEIPRAEPEQLSFLIAAAFNLENEVKYEMLEERSTAARFDRLSTILKQSVDQMEENAEIFRVAQTNGHGKDRRLDKTPNADKADQAEKAGSDPFNPPDLPDPRSEFRSNQGPLRHRQCCLKEIYHPLFIRLRKFHRSTNEAHSRRA